MVTPVETTSSTAIDRFLDIVADGRGGEARSLYAHDAVLDATVPDWRFRKYGGEAIGAVWSHWFAESGRFLEFDRLPVAGGEVLRYAFAGEEDGTPFVVHHCHIVTLDDETGLITGHRVWCGGRWYPARLAEMEAAQRAEAPI